jgi:hypothetical protein
MFNLEEGWRKKKWTWRIGGGVKKHQDYRVSNYT